MGDKFKISELQSARLQQEATNVDRIAGNNNGGISKKELKKLQTLLNGDEALKAELNGESDDIKKMFGYTGSVQATQTKAPEAPTPTVATPVAADNDKKAEQKSDETKDNEVKNTYYTYRGIDPITREPLTDASGNPVKGLSPKEAYEAVKKAYKGNKEYNDSVDELRKYSIDTEAKLVVLDAINRCSATSSKEVKKQAEALLKSEGNWDKHTKKALNGKGHSWWSNTFNWASLRDSDMKLYRKAQAAGNNAGEVRAKTYTKKDFTDAIGKRSPLFKEDENGYMAIEKLVDVEGNPLVRKQADGSYDITNLSRFISTQIGADNTLSRQQNKADAELEAIRAELRRDPNNIELTKRDTKQLVEFCGYRVEHKNLVKAAYNGALGAGAAALGTATVIASRITNVNVHNHIELTLSQEIINDITSSAELQKYVQDGSIQIAKGNAGILIDQNIFCNVARHIALNTLISAGIGAAVGALAGLLEYGPSEEDIFSTRLECRSYEDFVKYVDARKELTDAQKITLKQVAMRFIIEGENGKAAEIDTQVSEWDPAQGKHVTKTVKNVAWDCKGFLDYLNEEAGYKSNLNRIELLRAAKNAPEPVTVKVTEVPEQPDDSRTEVKEAYVAKDSTLKDFDKFNGANKHAWQDLVKMYDCISDLPYKVQSRFLKVMQGFKKNDFTYEQIMQIVELSKPGKKVTESTKAAIKALDFITDDNFDVDMFAAHVNTPGAVGDDNKQIIALREIKNANGNVVCTRDDSKVTRTITRNGGVKGGSKGTTAGQYREDTYWHRDTSGRVSQDASQDAQNRWAESQRQQRVKVTSVEGGRDALDRIGK